MSMRKKIVFSIVCIGVLLFSLCGLGPSEGAFLSVRPEQCYGCKRCVAVCNADAIVMISNKAVIDPSKCIKCMKCIDTCPQDAIQ